MSKENIHYPGHLVQYSMCNYEIESFNKYTVMLSDLEKVGWVVLKTGYNINPYCDFENALYDLNNEHSNKKAHWFSIDGKENNFFTSKKNTLVKSSSLTGLFQIFTIY